MNKKNKQNYAFDQDMIDHLNRLFEEENRQIANPLASGNVASFEDGVTEN
jgi:hypothetical protein